MGLLRNWLVPDEWQSAIATWREMYADVRLSSLATFRHSFAYLLVWGAGGWLGLLAWDLAAPALLVGSIGGIDSAVKAILTMAGVLSGFMITLMLFTGKTEAWKSLTLEQASAFAEKANYLIFSQFVTLVNHILVICSCVVWFVFAASGRASDTKAIIIALAGFLLVSLFRTILIPLQIAELHRFALSALIAEKNSDVEKEIEKLRAGKKP